MSRCGVIIISIIRKIVFVGKGEKDKNLEWYVWDMKVNIGDKGWIVSIMSKVEI